MEELICYCFGYTKEDIINDLKQNKGVSLILKRIMSEKRAGNCRCKEKNPKRR